MARAHGDGTLYPDKDAAGNVRWRGSIVVGWAVNERTGKPKPIRRGVSAKTKTEAARRLRALVRERDDGRRAWDKAPTVHAWLDYWLAEIAGPNCEPNTLVGYEVAVRRFKAHVPARLRLDALEPEHFDTLYAAMARDGGPAIARPGARPRTGALSATTIRLQHRIIRGALAVAVKRGRLARNPADLVEPPSPVAYNARIPTPAQAAAILAAAGDRDDFCRWAISLLLGARQGEVLALERERVDLDRRVIRFTFKTYRKTGAGILIGRTKADRERVLPIPDLLVEPLREHLAAVRRARMLAGPSWKGYRTEVDGVVRDVDLVFPNGVGRPRSREHDWDRWRALCVAAGVPHVRLHDARVATASYCAEAGVNPKVAAELLGHAQVQTTLDIYTKVPTHVARAAVEAVAALLLPTGTDQP